MLWQKRESLLGQTLQVPIASKTQDTVFWLVQMTLYIMLLQIFPLFIGPNLISVGPNQQTGFNF